MVDIFLSVVEFDMILIGAVFPAVLVLGVYSVLVKLVSRACQGGVEVAKRFAR
jgi:hypothetical protein